MDVWINACNTGLHRTSQSSHLTIRAQFRRINTYVYLTRVPMVPPEEMEARSKKAEEKLNVDMGRLWEWWETELLPEIKEHLAYWENFDLRGVSMSTLIAHLEDTQVRLARLFHIHFLLTYTFLQAPSLFDELYQDLFGKRSALDAYRLLQGFSNRTVEGNQALWELSRKALTSSQVGRVLEQNEPAQVPAALEQSAEGRAFLNELGDYLEEYGQRSDIFGELSQANWIENPATPIKNLQDFLIQPDRDLGDEMMTLAVEREQLIADARARLKEYSRPVVKQFEFLLKAAQAAIILQEDHNHWIEQRAVYKVRQVLLEFGRRFAEAGVIEQSNDVFFLTSEELPVTATTLPQGDRRQLVTQRKSEMDHFRAIQPPTALGTLPSGPPPDTPLSRALGKFFGTPPQPSTESNALRGNACSAGKVRGVAKVVLSLAEAGKLQPGDIMVAPASMPAWTPLFASIAAVVTDVGGILCHAAIVAREYKIPAVLGTRTATSVIQDGQILEVDGDAGIVRIVTSL
jgi:pyruvate,water dikinase